MLYALGVGLGQDPMNEDELAFVYEKNLKALPTFALVLGYPAVSGCAIRTAASTWDKVVHGEQGFTLHPPVAPQGTVIGTHPHRRGDRQGRGQGRADLFRAPDHRQGERRPARDADADHVLPRRRRLRRPAARSAGAACAAGARARPRLRSADAAGNGADLPAVRRHQSAARRSRLRQGRRLPAARSCTGSPPSASPATRCSRASAATIRRGSPRMAGRFSAPVFPGETIRTEIWRDGNVVSFRARVVERDVVAINNGRAEIDGMSKQRRRSTDSRRHPRRRCARCAPSSPANTGARSTASAPIRRSSSRR